MQDAEHLYKERGTLQMEVLHTACKEHQGMCVFWIARMFHKIKQISTKVVQYVEGKQRGKKV